MSILRIKLCGLNEADHHSLKSMLNLAQDQLSNPWQITDNDEAELYIYVLDTDEGKVAWQQHDSSHVSALLSVASKTDEDFDIIIKKPLRTKNFSITLNKISDKLTPGSDSKKHSPSFISTLSTKLQSLIGKKVSSKILTLDFSVPKQATDINKAINSSSELQQWLSELKHSPNEEKLLENLVPINRIPLPTKVRLELLAIYYDEIQSIFSPKHLALPFQQDSHSSYIKQVHSLNLLINELLIGYKIVINELQQQQNKPSADNPLFIATFHAVELLSLSIQQAYYYYLSPTKDSLNTLHQLYLFAEQQKMIDTPLSQGSTSLRHIYSATLLTGIADPSRLFEHEFFDLYALANSYADKITITEIQDAEVTSNNTGSFILDLTSDSFPTSLSASKPSHSATSELRIFNTYKMLEESEISFQSTGDDPQKQLRLLKKIIPQFNSSYQRRFKRESHKNKSKIKLLLGFSSIHNFLSTEDVSLASACTVHNQSTGGIMISSTTLDGYHLKIGAIVAILDASSDFKSAIVRWIMTDADGVSQIGLEFHSHPAVAIEMAISNDKSSFPGLILPTSIGTTTNKTILVEKATYLPLQIIKVTEAEKTYKIAVDSLIDNTFNCSQFSFTIKPD